LTKLISHGWRALTAAMLLVPDLLASSPAAAETIPLPRPRPAELGRSLDSAPAIPLPPLRPSIPPVLETQAKPPPPSACQLHLREIAVVETLPPVIAENGCGIEDPVKISAVMTRDNGRIAIAPPATLRCCYRRAAGSMPSSM